MQSVNDDGAAAFDAAFSFCPAVAILRGITPDECIAVAEVLVECGFRIVEVPLNSPQPCESIRRLRAHFGKHVVIGAGTVITPDEVDAVAAAGGQICVAPNCDPRVIRRALSRGMVPVPGVATATEAFAAIEAGGRYLKVFPAGALGPGVVKALLSVLPAQVRLLAVGGISADNLPGFFAAGCVGFGTGGDVYKAGSSPDEVRARAMRIMGALHALRDSTGTRSFVSAERVRRVAATTTLVGESPFWNERTGEIIWVDFGAHSALRCNPSTGAVAATSLDIPLSAIMAAPDGRILGVAPDTIRQVDLDTGVTTALASVELPFPDTRLNDAAIDPLGRVWSGSMSYAVLSGQGALFVMEPDGHTRRIAGGFGVCNGIDWSPDYRTLFMVDTLHRTLLAFDCDIEAGTVRRPRIVTDFMNVPGKPDGLAVGPDGGVWVAMWGGSRVVRVEADGRVSREIVLPAKHASSCCFRETDADTLYVSTSRFRLTPEELATAPWSGALLAIDLQTR